MAVDELQLEKEQAMTEDAQERQLFFDAWQKRIAEQKLDPLQKQIVKTIQMHPEFQDLVSNRAKYAEYEFPPDETDLLAHMALHVIIAEKISSDDPSGIRSRYNSAIREQGNKHEVQRKFIEALFDWYVFRSQEDQISSKKEDFLELFRIYLN